VLAFVKLAIMDSLALRDPPRGKFYVAEEPAADNAVRPAVYLDATIPSYMVPRSRSDSIAVRHQRITRVWWERYGARYDLKASYPVIREISAGDPVYVRQRVQILDAVTMLPFDERSSELASHLIGGGLLPQKAIADAEHIAIAAIHSVDYLLTWNCKHLANVFLARKVARTCEKLGFSCPEICTPEQLMRICAHARLNH
jgi:hypothetical protein